MTLAIALPGTSSSSHTPAGPKPAELSVLLEALARRLFLVLGPRLHIRAATPRLVLFFHGTPPSGFAGFGGERLFADSTALGADGLARHQLIEAFEGAVVALTFDSQGSSGSCMNGQALLAGTDTQEGSAFISEAIARHLRDMALPIAAYRDALLAKGISVAADQAIIEVRNKMARKSRPSLLLPPNP